MRVGPYKKKKKNGGNGFTPDTKILVSEKVPAKWLDDSAKAVNGEQMSRRVLSQTRMMKIIKISTGRQEGKKKGQKISGIQRSRGTSKAQKSVWGGLSKKL